MASPPSQQPPTQSSSVVPSFNGQISNKSQQSVQSITSQRKRFAWTGFSGKTLWDWLQLLAVLAVPLAVAFGTTYFTYQQARLSDVQHQREVDAANLQHTRDLQATNDQQETELKAYFDDIQTLLLQYNLSTSLRSDPVRYIARAKTLVVLHNLNEQRKLLLIHFLYDAGLLNVPSQSKPNNPIITLYDADFTNVQFGYIYLKGTDLAGIRFDGADLHGAHLDGSNLLFASLNRANLEDANLTGATVTKAQLNEASSCKDMLMPNGQRHSQVVCSQ